MHLCIAIDTGIFGVALFLYLPCFDNSFADRFTGFSPSLVRYLIEWYGNDFYLNVNPVEQRAGNFIQIFLYLPGTAYTSLRRMIIISARARIHRSYQCKTGRVIDAAFYSGDCDSPVFQWLPQYLKYVSIKLRQFAIIKILAPL